jgi:predicted amidophosphoribosyltransferase
VTLLKSRGSSAAARMMAAQIAASAPLSILHAVALVPVPAHPARRRRRGFNQAELLAGALAEATGLPLLDCLERGGPPTRQVGRDRAQRARAIAGRLTAGAGAKVPHSAVVVDDVITTGATVAACARALHAAGVRHVQAVAYARTPGR